MAMRHFIRTTEYGLFLNFLKELESKRRLLYVSNFNAMALVPNDYTGVFIAEDNETITVFVERNKNSLKVVTA